MKICSHCKIEKLESEFHKNCSHRDGLQNQCKNCRGGGEQQCYQLHRVEILTRQKIHSQTPAGKRSNNKKIRKYQKNFPEKRKAASVVYCAIRSGRLIRPATCPFCNTETFIEAHHPDYSKPLEVIWLCRPCHRKLHKSNK